MAGKIVSLSMITQVHVESDDVSQHENPIQSTNLFEPEFKSIVSILSDCK